MKETATVQVKATAKEPESESQMASHSGRDWAMDLVKLKARGWVTELDLVLGCCSDSVVHLA